MGKKKSKKRSKGKSKEGVAGATAGAQGGAVGRVEGVRAAVASLPGLGPEGGGDAAAGGGGVVDEGKEVVQCLKLITQEAERDAEGTFRRLKRGGHLAAVVRSSGGGDEGPRVAECRCSVVAWLALWEGAFDPLMAAGAGSMALAALRTHGEADAEVAAEACRAVGFLAAPGGKRDARISALVGEGAVHLVVAALSAHGSAHARVAQSACFALSHLTGASKVEEAVCEAVVKEGGVPLIVQALRLHGETDAEVGACTPWACVVVGNLAAPAGKRDARISALVGEGAVHLVVAALSAHGSAHARVAQSACFALGYLTGASKVEEAVCEAVVKEGGVPVIVEALRVHGEKDADVARCACFALNNLAAQSAQSAHRCDLLERAGALHAVLAAAKVHGKANAGLAEGVCSLVGWLVKPGTLEGPRAEAMLRVGVREVVADLAAAHGASNAKVAGNAVLVLRNLDAAAARRPCDGPGCAGEGTKRCARCHRTAYCSRDCQVAHWNASHKGQCHLPLTLGASVSGESAEAERPATCDGPGCSRTTKRGGEGGEGGGGALTLCPRCRAKRYCSCECQRAHWKAGHKAECRPALEA